MFSSKSFRVSDLTFRSLIHFEFIIVYGVISSVAQSCPTLCNPRNRSTPGLPVGKDVEKREPLYTIGVMDIGTATVENSMGVPQKSKDRTTI